MALESLFDRLTLGESSGQMEVEESIRRHLLRMFTARQGSVQALPDFGLPDINDLTLSRAELLQNTCKAIQLCIARYEPRLCGIEVSHLAGEGSLSSLAMEFHLTATLCSEQGIQTPWEWSIVFDWDKIRGRT